MTRATTERPRCVDSVTMLLVGVVSTHVMGSFLLGMLFALILYAVTGVFLLAYNVIADAIDRRFARGGPT